MPLKFTPLEFETPDRSCSLRTSPTLKFTPLEFETPSHLKFQPLLSVKIYSVGV